MLQALTFPENFRKTLSPPLPNVNNLIVWIVRFRCPQTVARVSDLRDSLLWMAPSAQTFTITFWDYDDPEPSEEDE